jgi:hypothetical protein
MRWAAVAVALMAAGCGVYSVRLDPPPRVTRPGAPLDLTVALGDVRSLANGRPEQIDSATAAAMDAEFVSAMRAAGLFRDVVSRGARADLYVDTVRELHAAPMTPGRTAYLIAVAPLAMLVPGFPHPFDYRVTRTVELRGDVNGTLIPLAKHDLAYDERVWGATYWGGLAAEPLRASEGSYLVAGVADVVESSRAAYERFAGAARTGDVEQAWLASVEASQTVR